MDKMMAFAAASAIFLLTALAASANPPNRVFAEYDSARQELGVQVEHIVSNVHSHFIEKVIVYKNGVEVTSKSFDFQTGKREQTMIPFKLPAVTGDTIKVIATCSRGGSGSTTITVE